MPNIRSFFSTGRSFLYIVILSLYLPVAQAAFFDKIRDGLNSVEEAVNNVTGQVDDTITSTEDTINEQVNEVTSQVDDVNNQVEDLSRQGEQLSNADLLLKQRLEEQKLQMQNSVNTTTENIENSANFDLEREPRRNEEISVRQRLTNERVSVDARANNNPAPSRRNITTPAVTPITAPAVTSGNNGSAAAVIAASGTPASADCKNVNPNSVDQVYDCLTSIPAMTLYIESFSSSLQGCGLLKTTYKQQINLANQEFIERPTPSCKVLSAVLEDLNGESPSWKECGNYIETGTGFESCLNNSYLADSEIKDNRNKLECKNIQSVMKSLSITILSVDERANFQGPTCPEIDNALAKSGNAMPNSECLNYQPNSSAHIEQCLIPHLSTLPEANRATDCNGLRQTYVKLLAVANGAIPSNYKIPRCSAFSGVLASIE